VKSLSLAATSVAMLFTGASVVMLPSVAGTDGTKSVLLAQTSVKTISASGVSRIVKQGKSVPVEKLTRLKAGQRVALGQEVKCWNQDPPNSGHYNEVVCPDEITIKE
jgi:hypothetical protein